jgi:hypothetical protein
MVILSREDFPVRPIARSGVAASRMVRLRSDYFRRCALRDKAYEKFHSLQTAEIIQ